MEQPWGDPEVAAGILQHPSAHQVSALRLLDDVRDAIAAAKRVSRFYPGRVACLELSLTDALTVAFQRGSVQWCLGVASDPQSFHAWIEADGEPITDPFDDPIPPTYQRVLAV